MNPMGDFSDHFDILRKNANSLICCKTDVSSSHGNRHTNLPPSNLHPSNAVQSALLGDRWRGPLYGTIEGCPDYASTNACQQRYPNIYSPRANITWRSRNSTLKYIRNAIYSDSEVGNLMHINLQYSQLESGIGEPLLKHPRNHLPYLTPSWILSLEHDSISQTTI